MISINNTTEFSLLLVTYNRHLKLKKILECIHSYQWPCYEIVIVDNNSTDDTSAFLKSLENPNKITVLNPTKNLGHGAALAFGFSYLLSKAKIPPYILLLEDDSIPSQNLYNQLHIGIHQSGVDLLGVEGYKVKIGIRSKLTPAANEIAAADFCLLDGALIKTSILQKTGLPETDWFMMFDDFEFCYRIRKAGFKIGVLKNDSHQILHLGGGERFTKATLWRGYYQSRNHTFFLKKHFTLWNFTDYLIIQFKRITGSLLAPDRFYRTYLRLKGILHGLISKKGRTLDPATLQFK
jgi:GT2 family glycosyltransferase